MSTENTNFDVNAFMNETMDGVLDTKIDPIPEGEYLGQIMTEDKSVDIATGVSPKNQKAWMRLDVLVNLPIAGVPALEGLKREKVTARYSIMLDLNEQGKLDMRPQRNVNLGKLRDAVNQNRPGPWSFAMLKGQPIKVKIKHRKADDGNTYSDVIAVTRAS